MQNNPDKNIQIALSSIFIALLIFHPFTLIDAQTILIKKPIRLGLSLWVPYFLAYIAQEKGIFKKNNVDVNLTFIQNYGDSMKAYSDGDLDGIMEVFSDAMIQNSWGINTKIVYSIDNSISADAIVGIGNNLSDIQGKKIGVDGINSFSHYLVLKSLERVGLSEGDVEFVNVPFQNVTSSLQKGQISAGHIYTPFISDATKKGFKILYIPGNIPGTFEDILAFNSDIVQQRPQDIRNIIKSLDEAKADYNKNKEQDILIMSSKAGLSKDKIIEGFNNAKLLDLNYNFHNSMNKTSNETTSLYTSGIDIAKFYIERGVISEYPTMDDLVDPQFVNSLLKDNTTKSQ